MFPALVWKPLIWTNSSFVYIFVLFYYMSYFRNNSNRIASRLRCITIILIQWVVSLGRDPAETVMKSSYRAQSRSKCKDGSRLRGVVLPCEFLSFFLEGHSTPNGYFDLFFHSFPPFFSVILSFFLSFFPSFDPSRIPEQGQASHPATLKSHNKISQLQSDTTFLQERVWRRRFHSLRREASPNFSFLIFFFILYSLGFRQYLILITNFSRS